MVRRLADNYTVNSVAFIFGAQTLDGFHWNHVAFVNTVIHYEGGEVELRNVRFIGCTFEIIDNPRGPKVATYATLDQASLRIGPGN